MTIERPMFPPRPAEALSRRMVIASLAALPGAGIPAPADAQPKALDLDSARPVLRDAIRRLGDAHTELARVDNAIESAWVLLRDWERKHPCPISRRASRKWNSRFHKYSEEIGFVGKQRAWGEARESYQQAQLALSRIRAADFEEIALKSAASVAFEGAILENSRHHLRNEKQIVAWSVAMDAVLLFGEPTALTA